MCATVPDSPAQPTTTVLNSNVIFDWDAPDANGTPITEYKVYIRKADLQYNLQYDLCNGKSSTVVQNTQCTVPLSALTSAPYNLQKGYSVNI